MSAGTEGQSGPFRPLAARNKATRAQNIHKRVAYDVSARCGAVRRALMPPGGHFGCPPGPPKQARFGRDQAAGWGTYLAQNGTARHPNCTGRLIGTLCAYSGGWAHQNYQSGWSLGHLGSGNLKTGVGATQGVFLKGVRPRGRPRRRGGGRIW